MGLAAKSASSSTTANTGTARIRAANAFLYVSHMSASAPDADTSGADPVKAELEEHDEFPDHHPKEMRGKGKSVRFHFKYSNVPELHKVLRSIRNTYEIHVLNKYCPAAHRTIMEEYLSKYPLGTKVPPIKDTRYYKNANNMVKVTNDNENRTAGTPEIAIPQTLPEQAKLTILVCPPTPPDRKQKDPRRNLLLTITPAPP